MALIDKETIRKEIERLIKAQLDKNGNAKNSFCAVRMWAYADLLYILDTLPEQPVEIHIDNPNIEKIDPSIKVETSTDGTGDIDGKAMLYVADKSYKIGFRDGKASKEQPVEGLEEEVERFYRTDEYKTAHNLGRGFETIARHFYELGCTRTAEMYDDIEYERQRAEEAENEEFKQEDINTEMGHWMSCLDDKYCMLVNHYSIQDIKDTARHFAEWQKNRDDIETADLLAIAHFQGMGQQKDKMLEEAVDGRYMKADGKVYVESWLLDIEPNSVKAGDEVKLIVIPKE